MFQSLTQKYNSLPENFHHKQISVIYHSPKGTLISLQPPASLFFVHHCGIHIFPGGRAECAAEEATARQAEYMHTSCR